MGPRAVFVGLVAAMALAAAPASAATVRFTPPPSCGGTQAKYFQCDPPSLGYAAAPGEVNNLALTLVADKIVFADPGVPVAAPSGCTSIDPSTVSCPGSASGYRSPPQLSVDLGDGNDTAANAFTPATIAGGEGDDSLTTTVFALLQGGPGADLLTGGAGSDVIDGGPGADTISAGGAKDRVIHEGAGSGSDAIDGGAGEDAVSYEPSSAGVQVDLGDPGPDGPAGEQDTVAGIEDVLGSSGADAITGDEGANKLSGGGGNDTVAGGPGDDQVEGGAGADAMSGGSGNDLMSAVGDPVALTELGSTSGPAPADQARETVECGDGLDRVGQSGDVLRPGCETAQLTPYSNVLLDLRRGPDPAALASRRPVKMALGCNGLKVKRGRCRIDVLIKSRGRVIARRTLRPRGRRAADRVIASVGHAAGAGSAEVLLRAAGMGAGTDRGAVSLVLPLP